MNNITTSYKILGISEASTETQLKSAYKRMAMIYHPDKLSPQSSFRNAETSITFVHVQQAYNNIVEERKKQNEIQVFKQYCSQKLMDLIESDTNDVQFEDDYFDQQDKNMAEKMSSIEQTLQRWRKSREKRQQRMSNQMIFSPPKQQRQGQNKQYQNGLSFNDLESKMDQIAHRIRQKINIFSVIHG